MTCNDDIPNLPATDKGVWNRVRVVPFETEFVEKHDLPSSKRVMRKQKKELMDHDFNKKIPIMKE